MTSVNLPDHSAVPAPHRRRTPVAITIAVLTTLVVAAGVVLWETSDSDSEDASWTRYDPASSGFGGRDSSALMTSVATHDDTTVAVGSEEWHRGELRPSTAAVWYSHGGAEWERVPRRDAVFGDPDNGAAALSVAANDQGFVAAGVDRSLGVTDAVGAVWTSSDGVDWQRVPHDDVFGGQGQGHTQIRSVTTHGSGFVAVGDAAEGAAVWTSDNGRTWTRARHENSPFERPGTTSMRSVTSGPSGLVAVGTEELPGFGVVAAVWRSDDGFWWQRVPHDDAFGNAFGEGYDATTMAGVAAGPDGYVSVGDTGYSTTTAAVWTSPDGRTWSRVPHRPQTFGVDDGYATATATDVTWTGEEFAATGARSDDEAPVRATLWTSRDGQEWQRDTGIRAFDREDGTISELWSITRTDDDRLIAVGRARPHDTARDAAAVWGRG